MFITSNKIRLAILLALSASGCRTHVAPPTPQAQHVILSEPPQLDGLTESRVIEALKVTCSAPGDWQPAPLSKTNLYAHQVWHSPTDQTGFGVAHLSMPLPLPAQMIIWFAKTEYARRNADGKMLARWSDHLGRQWFEAKTNAYHVQGYAITRGCDAWIVYRGWRTGQDPQAEEFALALKSLETVNPTR